MNTSSIFLTSRKVLKSASCQVLFEIWIPFHWVETCLTTGRSVNSKYPKIFCAISDKNPLRTFKIILNVIILPLSKFSDNIHFLDGPLIPNVFIKFAFAHLYFTDSLFEKVQIFLFFARNKTIASWPNLRKMLHFLLELNNKTYNSTSG